MEDEGRYMFGGDLRPSWYNGQLLQLAHDLASRLLPAFQKSITGIPYPRVGGHESTFYSNLGPFDNGSLTFPFYNGRST